MKAMLLAIIVMFTVAIGVSAAYAIEATVDIPFDNWVDHVCGIDIDTLDYVCVWTPSKGDATIFPSTEEDEIDDKEGTQDEGTQDEVEYTPTKKPKFDLKIYLSDPLSMSSYSSREVLDAAIKDENLLGAICFNPAGAEIENTIDFGKLGGKINVKRQFDNQPLQQHPDLKAEHLLSEMCKSIRTLEYIVENPLRTYPGEGWAYSFNLNYDLIDKFMENITKTEEYSKREINARTFFVTQEDAADFMCNADGKARGLCVQEFTGTNKGGYIDTTNNPVLAKLAQYNADPANAKGEPKYSVKTNPKCAILASFITLNEISEENGNTMLKAAGCKT